MDSVLGVYGNMDDGYVVGCRSGVDPWLILGCWKILHKKTITIRCVKWKRFYSRLCWPKLHLNGNIMTLAWVDKLSEQRAIFNNLLSFYLYSLLHKRINTFIKSFTCFGLVQYKHHTFSGKYLINTTFY